MIGLEDVEYDVIVPMFAALDFFHPALIFFVCKAHVVFKVFYFHLSQVNFYVSDYVAGHGLDDGQNVVDCHWTVRVGFVDVEFREVFHNPTASIHGK